MPMLIDLAQNRTLTIRARGHRCSVTVAPIAGAVWFESFFDAMAAFLGKCRTPSERQDATCSVAFAFFDRTAIAMRGYPTLEGVPQWQSKIPFPDKEAFANLLLDARELDGTRPPSICSGGVRVVRLQSLWNSNPMGAMSRHRDLVHHFKAPSQEQRDIANYAYLEKRRIAGFARRGEPSVFAPTQTLAANALVPLYDNLITRVEGYCVNGEPLGENRAEIIRNMDAFHKVVAVRPLFAWTPAQIKEMMVM